MGQEKDKEWICKELDITGEEHTCLHSKLV